jgi:hypothetical protein
MNAGTEATGFSSVPTPQTDIRCTYPHLYPRVGQGALIQQLDNIDRCLNDGVLTVLWIASWANQLMSKSVSLT